MVFDIDSLNLTDIVLEHEQAKILLHTALKYVVETLKNVK